MFGSSYFGARFFASLYFAAAGAASGGTETAVEVYGGSTTVDDFVTVGSDMEYSRIAGAISGATQVYGGGTNVDDSADTVFSDSTFEYSRT